MKRKILTLLCMIVFILSALTVNVFARITSATCALTTDKSTYKKGDTVTVTFKLSSLNADKGIVAYGGILEYDEDNLEYTGRSGIGNWEKPDYNEDTGNFVATSGEYSSMDGEDLCTFTFKVKTEQANNVKIAVKSIELGNGTPGTAPDVETTITIKKDSTTKPDNPSDPDDPSNPDNPDNPDNPSDSDDPSNPDSPSDPDSPSNPSNPSNPDNPSDPSNPSNPDNPTKPNNPSNPNNSTNQGQNGSSSNGSSNNGSTGNNQGTVSIDPIPQTGSVVSTVLLSLLGVAVALVVIFLIKIKIIDKKIKRGRLRF